MFHPQIKIVEDISPNDKLSKGRRFVILYENTPIDFNAILMTGFDLECVYKEYCKMMEKLGSIKCDKCGYYSNVEGRCQNCDKKLKDITK